MGNYKDLLVWQKAIDLAVLIYDLVEKFPPYEQYGLSNQMRRSVTSISLNIAEGSKRGSKNEFRYFLKVAHGSGAEIETQLYVIKRLKWGKELDLSNIEPLLTEIMCMLYKLTTLQR